MGIADLKLLGDFEARRSDGQIIDLPEMLERAAGLYRGDLLEGFAVHDPSFEDWLAVKRQRLRRFRL